MTLFPVFLKLRNRRCLVVGAGAIAEGKIESLLKAEADVVVVAPEFNASIAQWHVEEKLRLERREFQPSDLDGVFLVISATSSVAVNEAVYREADARGILCNAVDDPDRCHFYYPSVVQRGALQIAVSTNGFSPALAQRLRKEMEQQFGPEYETWLEWLNSARQVLFQQEMDPERRKAILHDIASDESFRKFLEQMQPTASKVEAQ